MSFMTGLLAFFTASLVRLCRHMTLGSLLPKLCTSPPNQIFHSSPSAARIFSRIGPAGHLIPVPPPLPRPICVPRSSVAPASVSRSATDVGRFRMIPLVKRRSSCSSTSMIVLWKYCCRSPNQNACSTPPRITAPRSITRPLSYAHDEPRRGADASGGDGGSSANGDPLAAAAPFSPATSWARKVRQSGMSDRSMASPSPPSPWCRGRRNYCSGDAVRDRRTTAFWTS
mmetsp:Transcript_21159/g.42401  ORF Transcript_21159/g.42401 Transcript_21159/m.42401 type:complete len:228 (+) Transcript_21159:764-1447(+)